MLEPPSIWRYSPALMGSDNPTGADNQQETASAGSSETARQAPLSEAMRQSDLHGDMQSQAEMTWPSHRQNRPCEGVTNVPKVAKFLVG